MSDYLNTPSFYNNEEYFNKYLGYTSYYLGLQQVVSKVVSVTSSTNVLELGAALGTTTLRLAAEYPQIIFEGSDIRQDVVDIANKKARDFHNAFFKVEDMCEAVKKDLQKYDLIFLLYSFHHILDPLENKIAFLNDSYKNMKVGGYMLITETFLPEHIEENKEEQPILDLWNLRAEEGYASTYWAALQDITDDGIDFAKRVASTSQHEESEAGNHVYRREEEYLVKFSWLVEKAEECGFKVIIAEPVNCLYENAILLRK